MPLDALVDRGVHEHREDHRRRAVDRHRHRGRRVAQIEARIELLHVVERGDRHARVADAAVDVRPLVRVLAVERRRIEGRRQTRRAVTGRHVVESPVGALRTALAREHPRRVLFLAAVRIDARGVREMSRQVLPQQEGELLAPVAPRRHRELRHAVAAQRLGVVLAADLAAAHHVAILVVGRRLRHRRPLPQQLDGLGADRIERIVVGVAQPRASGIASCRRAPHRRSGRAPPAAADRRARAAPRAGCSRGSQPRRGAADPRARAARSPRSRRDSACAASGTSACRSTSSHRARIRDRPARLAARLRIEQARERVEQPVDPGIVEPARDRRKDRDLGIGRFMVGVIAPPLLAHVAQRILRAALLELVERDQLGEIEHVDLLELARGAVLARHHVHRHVDQVDDLRVALADACRLDHDQVEPGALEQVDACRPAPRWSRGSAAASRANA